MESVISGGVYVGNGTSHERQSDFFVGEEAQRRERVSGFTRIQAIRSL